MRYDEQSNNHNEIRLIETRTKLLLHATAFISFISINFPKSIYLFIYLIVCFSVAISHNLIKYLVSRYFVDLFFHFFFLSYNVLILVARLRIVHLANQIFIVVVNKMHISYYSNRDH